MEAAELRRTNLSTLDLVNFGFQYEEVRNMLPSLKEALKMERSDLAIVISNIVGEDFKTFIDQRQEERNTKLQEKQNILDQKEKEKREKLEDYNRYLKSKADKLLTPA